MPKPDDSRQKEIHVYRIIDNPLEVVESEHGLWGLDHVAEIVNARRRALTAEISEARSRPHDD